MLVTFSCDAHENITMFGDVAVRLLKIMGHSGTVPSALLAEDIPEALARLQQEMAVENIKSGQRAQSAFDEDEDEISLPNRALPLIELLEDAVKNKCNVMWQNK